MIRQLIACWGEAEELHGAEEGRVDVQVIFTVCVREIIRIGRVADADILPGVRQGALILNAVLWQASRPGEVEGCIAESRERNAGRGRPYSPDADVEAD